MENPKSRLIEYFKVLCNLNYIFIYLAFENIDIIKFRIEIIPNI